MTQSARFEEGADQNNSPIRAFSQFEKFEVLSAYLDDEATEQEQRWIRHWLLSDLQLQQQYQNQLRIRAAIRRL